MKRIIAAVLALLTVASFAACGGTDEETTTTTTKKTTTTTTRPAILDEDGDPDIDDEGNEKYDPDAYVVYGEGIVVDGVKDEVWSKAQGVNVDIKAKDNAEATVVAYSMYDSERLYFFFEIEDENISQINDVGNYTNDGFFLWISEQNQFGSSFSSYSEGTYQFAIINEELSMYPRKGIADELADADCKCSINIVAGEGITIEFSYKPQYLKLEAGSQFSLDYQYNDCTDGVRIGTLQWIRPNDGDQDPSSWGIVELLANGAEIPPIEE